MAKWLIRIHNFKYMQLSRFFQKNLIVLYFSLNSFLRKNIGLNWKENVKDSNGIGVEDDILKLKT